jgi:hypothetical protein
VAVDAAVPASVLAALSAAGITVHPAGHAVASGLPLIAPASVLVAAVTISAVQWDAELSAVLGTTAAWDGAGHDWRTALCPTEPGGRILCEVGSGLPPPSTAPCAEMITWSPAWNGTPAAWQLLGGACAVCARGPLAWDAYRLGIPGGGAPPSVAWLPPLWSGDPGIWRRILAGRPPTLAELLTWRAAQRAPRPGSRRWRAIRRWFGG